MNLEAVEQRCLSYLKQVRNPMVAVEQLLRHLREDEQCRDVDEKELLDFLQDHELFKLVEPAGLALDPQGEEALAKAGLPTSCHVMLSTRAPTPVEWAAAMTEQLETLKQALLRAREDAVSQEHQEQQEKTEQVLHRLAQLNKRLDEIR